MWRVITLKAPAVWMLQMLLLLVLVCTGCYAKSSGRSPRQETMPRKDINVVLDEHDDAIIKIPGVVGMYKWVYRRMGRRLVSR